MSPLQNITVLRRSPLIVTADAISETPRGKMFKPPAAWIEFEGVPHLIQAGISRGDVRAGIKPAEQMILMLRPI